LKQDDKKALAKYRKKLEFARDAGDVDVYETGAEKEARIARAKKDPRFCARYYFPHYCTSEAADFHIKGAKATLKDPLDKAFDQWGRGLAKSVWDDVINPFWLWMNDQANYKVIVTTSKDRAMELLDDLRAEWETNPRIINDFGEQKNEGQWEKGFYITKGGFIGKALGAGQNVRGLRVKDQRPDYIVVDDLETKELIANPKRQLKLAKWIERDLIPTMDGPIRRFKYACNRFAPSMIQTILQERHPKWRVLEVNAYDPVTYKPTWFQKYDDDYYKTVEDEIGVLAAKAEFNNQPHIEGTIFKEEDFQWGKVPALNHFKVLCGFWDVAYAGTQTSDFNAIRVWGLKEKDFWYIDSIVRQCKIRVALEWMAQFQMNLPETVIIHWKFEGQFWNDEILRTIREVEGFHRIHLNLVKVDTPKTNKYDRILTLQPYYQNGRIYHNEAKKSHKSTQEGNAQLLGIEPGYKTPDDAPDADQQAIKWLSSWLYTSRRSGMLTGNIKRETHF
jgi:predicted phage terminase large subunit-like protein